MSRTRAKKELSIESLHESMKGRTWLAEKDKALLDEHPQAYKDIGQVMEDSAELVDIEHRLEALVNYKGA